MFPCIHTCTSAIQMPRLGALVVHQRVFDISVWPALDFCYLRSRRNLEFLYQLFDAILLRTHQLHIWSQHPMHLRYDCKQHNEQGLTCLQSLPLWNTQDEFHSHLLLVGLHIQLEKECLGPMLCRYLQEGRNFQRLFLQVHISSCLCWFKSLLLNTMVQTTDYLILFWNKHSKH